MRNCAPVNVSNDDSTCTGLLALFDKVRALKALLGVCLQELLREFIVTYTPRIYDGFRRKHVLEARQAQI